MILRNNNNNNMMLFITQHLQRFFFYLIVVLIIVLCNVMDVGVHVVQGQTLFTTDSYSTSDGGLLQHNPSNKTAVIHVGPHKTGTSSIQGDMKHLIPYLRQDHYELPLDSTIETVAMGNIRNCFCPVCKSIEQYLDWTLDCNMQQVQTVRDIAARGSNIIISAETFSFHTTDIGSFRDLIVPAYENPIIVVYYRRFYDWLYSQWNQLNKMKPIEERETFNQWMSTIDKLHVKFYENHYTYAVVPRWKQYFHNVQVFNMHDKTKTAPEMFFCDAIPNAPHTCKRLLEQQDKKGDARYNKSRALVYEELAYYATKLGLLRNVDLTIRELTSLVQKQQEEVWKLTEHDFYIGKVCFDEEKLNFLLLKTLLAEKEFFPEFYAQQGEQEIRIAFEKDKTTRLCHIDANIVLQHDTKWRTFFQGL